MISKFVQLWKSSVASIVRKCDCNKYDEESRRETAHVQKGTEGNTQASNMVFQTTLWLGPAAANYGSLWIQLTINRESGISLLRNASLAAGNDEPQTQSYSSSSYCADFSELGSDE